MVKTRRLMLTVTDEMHAAIKRQAIRRGATQSGLVRVILGEWLEQQGEVVDWAVEWGGRHNETEDQPEET
jgi:hypothetical protein